MMAGCHYRCLVTVLYVFSLLSSSYYCNGQQDEDTKTTTTSSFLWLSDIHLEPDYGTPQASTKHNEACTMESAKESFPYGQFGCDAPTLLVEQTLDHAQLVVSAAQNNYNKIDFILATGDFSRHGNEFLEHPVQLTREILETVMDMIISRFPGVPIIVSVGNNDFTPDYYIDVTQEEAAATTTTTDKNNNTMLELVTNAFNDTFQTEEEVLSFRTGARFVRNVSDTLTILSINTIMYSVEHTPLHQETIEDPFGQFRWMKTQLELAKSAGRKVWIVGHIAPTIGSWAHDNLWHLSYVDRYFETIRDYFPTVICGQLFGHLHTDEFRLAHHDDKDASYANAGGFMSGFLGKQYPLYIASSFTSIYGSNPSYRVVQYETNTGNLLDYDTYYFNQTTTKVPPDWIKAPSFRESFNIPDMSGSSLDSIINRMAAHRDEFSAGSSSSIWDTFISRQSINAPPEKGPCDDLICRKEWICTLSSISEDQYEKCVVETWKHHYRAPTGPLAVVAASVATAIVLVGCIWKIGRCILVRRNYELHYDDDEHLQDEDDNFRQHSREEIQQQSSAAPTDDFIDVPEIT